MTTIGVPNQTAFLSSLGFSCDEKAKPLEQEPTEANMRNLALIISNFKASRPIHEPTANSKVANIERLARKTRAAMSLRYQLIASEVNRGEAYNPLATIRNRSFNNFHTKEGLWTVSNDEILHDIAYRRGCDRAPAQCQLISPNPYQCPRDSRHESQFLISRLQEKHTSGGFSSQSTPQIVVSGPDTHSTYSSSRSGSRSEEPCETSEEEPEFLTVETYPKSSGSVRTSISGRSAEEEFLSDFSICPQDKYLECASSELEYISSVLEAALRQHKSRKAPLCQRFCHIYTKTLQETVIPKHLDYLAKSERIAGEMYQQIEKSIINPTENLKLESDRMIADINTSLNLQLRDCATMMTELERCSHTDCLKQLSYYVLEWTVFILLRAIWAVVSIWHVIRFALTALGIWSPQKRKVPVCVRPTPLPTPRATPGPTPQLTPSVSPGIAK